MEKKVLDYIKKLENIAKEVYGVAPKIKEIKFTKRGKSAGECAFYHSSSYEPLDSIRGSYSFVINFNKTLLNENKEEFLKVTVPHEYAHAVAQVVYGTFAHDSYWRAVMNTFGIPNASRTHNYKTTPVRVVKRKFQYTCDCGRDWRLTAIRHNRIVKGTRTYSCPNCRSTLHFIKELA